MQFTKDACDTEKVEILKPFAQKATLFVPLSWRLPSVPIDHLQDVRVEVHFRTKVRARDFLPIGPRAENLRSFRKFEHFQDLAIAEMRGLSRCSVWWSELFLNRRLITFGKSPFMYSVCQTLR